jgi:hypothetical protein
MFGEAERLDEDRLRTMRHLGAVPHREEILRVIESRDDPARLDRVTSPLVETKSLGQAQCRAREGAIDVAEFDGGPGDKVVGTFEPDFRCARSHRRDGINDGRQRLVVDGNKSRRILGDTTALRHHERDRLPHMADLTICEPCRLDIELDGGAWQCEWNSLARYQWPQITINEHRAHARQPTCPFEVDMLDEAVGDGAARESRVKHAGYGDVVDEAACPAQ